MQLTKATKAVALGLPPAGADDVLGVVAELVVVGPRLATAGLFEPPPHPAAMAARATTATAASRVRTGRKFTGDIHSRRPVTNG
jgi:hypothetical protein